MKKMLNKLKKYMPVTRKEFLELKDNFDTIITGIELSEHQQSQLINVTLGKIQKLEQGCACSAKTKDKTIVDNSYQ